MSISLEKGQKVDLTKTNPGLSEITVGLGWDTSGSLLKSLFSGSSSFDLDASVFMLENDKLTSMGDRVYYGHLGHSSGSVLHMGDNLTGVGNGDDEQIKIKLNIVSSEYNKLVFVVNIFDCKSRKQHFGMIKNAFIRIVNSVNGEELCRYNLSDNYNGMTAMIFGEVYRHNNEWKFTALGQGTTDTNIGGLSQLYK